MLLSDFATYFGKFGIGNASHGFRDTSVRIDLLEPDPSGGQWEGTTSVLLVLKCFASTVFGMRYSVHALFSQLSVRVAFDYCPHSARLLQISSHSDSGRVVRVAFIRTYFGLG